MPVTAADIAKASKTSLDFHIKKVTDQISVERPLLKVLVKNKKTFPGAKEHIVEHVRKSTDSTFQGYSGDDQVTYNFRDPLHTAKYEWRSFHDGYKVTETEMSRNGIILTDDVRGKKATKADAIQLVNLFKEYNYDLMEGFKEKLSQMLHFNGAASPNNINGLDAIVSLTPAVGVLGGIDRATNSYWRNYAMGGIKADNILHHMEAAWRFNTKHGGQPNLILAGATFIDTYQEAVKGQVTLNINSGKQINVEGGISSVSFKGIPIIWSPEFEVLDDIESPKVPWATRCYLLNTKYITLRVIDGQWMIARTPPRIHDRYSHFQALTASCALTSSRLSAHSVLTTATI